MWFRSMEKHGPRCTSSSVHRMQRNYFAVLPIFIVFSELHAGVFSITINRTRQQSTREDKMPTSCAEVLKYGKVEGMYKLYLPESDLKPFYVYCLPDPDNGKAWTVFQRHRDNATNFVRNWHEYSIGFGNLFGDFWIGLDKLHALTYDKPQELWIKREDFNGDIGHAFYDAFAIGDEDSKFAIQALGRYSGTAGDNLSRHGGKKFSTRDADNDERPSGNCADIYAGGWWFYDCCQSHLNGLIWNQDDRKSMRWGSWVLKYSHMAIRPMHTRP